MRDLLAGMLLLLCGCGGSRSSPPLSATIKLSPLAPNEAVAGDLDAREAGKDVTITGTVTGLPAGKYQVHLHQPQGCPPPPTGEDSANHKLDLGLLTADASGKASLEAKIPGAQIGGAEPITGSCVVILPADASRILASGKILSGGYGFAPR